VPGRTLDSPIVSHPSLGRPPLDPTAGSPEAARRIQDAAASLAARALATAIDRDPTLRARNDEVGLRQRLRDAELLAERIALSVAAGDPAPAREYADWTAPVYRRKRVPLDDLINLCEGLRAALPATVSVEESVDAERAIDEAIAQYRWHRRLAGDARKRNAFLQFIYKGG
jgi:Phycobilisome protein